MKIRKSFLLVVPLVFSLFSCSNKAVVDEKELLFEEAKRLVANYSILQGRGFDYSTTQTYEDTVVNSRSIEVRIDRRSYIKAARLEKTKELNTDILGSQFIETETTQYYYSNNIYTATDDGYDVTSGNLKDFINFNLIEPRIEFFQIKNISLLNASNYTIKITLDSKIAKKSLGISGDISNFVLYVTKNEKEELTSYKITYSVPSSNFSILFVPCYTKTNIEMPPM